MGVLLLIDCLLAALTAAGLVSTIGDRGFRDQAFFAGTVLAGSLLVIGGMRLITGEDERLGSTLPVAALVITAIVSMIEVPWREWIDTVPRWIYTAVAVFTVRKTQTVVLPTD
jgi:hypothetical protein